MVKVHYCNECGVRVDERSIESGEAIESDGRVWCAAHAHLAPANTKKKSSRRKGSHPTARGMEHHGRGHAGTRREKTPAYRAEESAPSSSGMVRWIVAGMVLVSLVIIVLFMGIDSGAGGIKPEPPPVEKKKPAPSTSKKAETSIKSPGAAVKAEKTDGTGTTGKVTSSRARSPVAAAALIRNNAALRGKDPSETNESSDIIPIVPKGSRVFSYNVWEPNNTEAVKKSLERRNPEDLRAMMKIVHMGLERESWPGIDTNKTEEINWADFRRYVVIVWAEEGIQLTLGFEYIDDNGKRIRYDKAFYLRPGRNRLEVTITEIGQHLDKSKIRLLILFLDHPRKDTTLYYESVRLEK